jgi:hypothetical protein
MAYSRPALLVALLVAGFLTGARAQTSKAMGVGNLGAITYSGTARTGAFGQSKAIGDPMGPVNVTQITAYTRTITFAPAADPAGLVSRATGPTTPPTVPGAPTPAQVPVVRAAVDALNKLKLDYNAWIPAHPPNPDKPLTRADVLAAAGTGN